MDNNFSMLTSSDLLSKPVEDLKTIVKTKRNMTDAEREAARADEERREKARVAAAEARGEAARLVSALGADPELAKGLVRRLGEVSRLVADLAAAAEE